MIGNCRSQFGCKEVLRRRWAGNRTAEMKLTDEMTHSGAGNEENVEHGVTGQTKRIVTDENVMTAERLMCV